MNNLQKLSDAGQAVWLDFLDRRFLKDGSFQQLIDQDSLGGVTSNPSIFEKAMGHGNAYDDDLRAFLKGGDRGAIAVYEHLAIGDIRMAADMLRPVYDRMGGRDGFASLEVSPYLADDNDGTVAEARRLWALVDRPNVMIKVPGTQAGTPAIRALIEDGINVNVTLLFSLSAYKAVAEAFMAGLEARIAKDEGISHIASVASFFVSRIDTKMDDKIAGFSSAEAKPLAGQIAIANAKLAYGWYQETIAGERWQRLAAKGAMPQRLLWASTGTKNPDYSDVYYIDALIGPDTVNTMPLKTMDAFRDHGTIDETLTADIAGARAVLAKAEALGLDLDGVTSALVVEGVKSFSDAFDALLGALEAKGAVHHEGISAA